MNKTTQLSCAFFLCAFLSLSAQTTLLKGSNIKTAVTKDESSELEIVVYPNPFAGFTTVTISSNAMYRLLSTLGVQLDSGTLMKGENNLDFSKLRSGAYFLEVKTTKVTAVKKLVKN